MTSPSGITRIKKRLADWELVKNSSRPEDLADAVFISNIFAEDIRFLLDENEHLKRALEVAERHINGTATRFSESEKTIVLHLIRQALLLLE
jgi:hypothetical protein